MSSSQVNPVISGGVGLKAQTKCHGTGPCVQAGFPMFDLQAYCLQIFQGAATEIGYKLGQEMQIFIGGSYSDQRIVMEQKVKKRMM